MYLLAGLNQISRLPDRCALLSQRREIDVYSLCRKVSRSQILDHEFGRQCDVVWYRHKQEGLAADGSQDSLSHEPGLELSVPVNFRCCRENGIQRCMFFKLLYTQLHSPAATKTTLQGYRCRLLDHWPSLDLAQRKLSTAEMRAQSGPVKQTCCGVRSAQSNGCVPISISMYKMRG